jgi:hypothetical protein
MKAAGMSGIVRLDIMGTKNIEQIKDNLTVLDQGPMNPEELNPMGKIGHVLPRIFF